MGKDITDWDTMPTLKYTGPIRILTADECEREAQKALDAISRPDVACDSEVLRWWRSEYNAWLKLARERRTPEDSERCICEDITPEIGCPIHDCW
jgi:hypothetical protein